MWPWIGRRPAEAPAQAAGIPIVDVGSSAAKGQVVPFPTVRVQHGQVVGLDQALREARILRVITDLHLLSLDPEASARARELARQAMVLVREIGL